MIKFIFLVNVLLYALTGIAREPRHYNFTHYTGTSGLISYQVNSTLQDEEGYIWIATNDGLQRYDGIRYRNFRTAENDPSAIPSKSISQVLKDKKKNLWLLTADGKAGIFNTKSFTFQRASIKTNKPIALRSILETKRLIADEFGNLFLLLAGNELLTYNEEKNEFAAAYNFMKLPDDDVMEFVQQPGTQKYWISIYGKGLLVYDRGKNIYYNATSNTESPALNDLFKTVQSADKIFFDNKNRIWIGGTAPGYYTVSCYDMTAGNYVIKDVDFREEVRAEYQVKNFLQQQDGNIWISGVRVLARFLEKEKVFESVYNGYEDDRSIDYILITHIQEDREHNIWVGTGNNGLYRFNPAEEFFTNIQHKDPVTGNYVDNSPIALMDDEDGSILVGLWNDKLYRHDKTLKEIPLDIKGFGGKNPLPVLHMYKPKGKNYVWMASTAGLYKYDPAKREVKYYHSDSLKSRIRVIAEDSKGNLWMGTQNHGVYKWNHTGNDGMIDIQKFSAISSQKINKMIIDKNGYLWIATSADGAYVINTANEQVIMHFDAETTPDRNIPEHTVSSLLEFNDSLVLIAGTTNLVVYNRNRNKISYLGKSNMTSGFISSMEKDKDGSVWLSTTAALYRINVFSRVFVRFNREDGIRNDYFIIEASHVLPDGRLMFGASANLLVFDPSVIKMETVTPQIVITDFKVSNQSWRVDSLLRQKTIVLASDENSIAIDLSTLSYNMPYLLRYKMEGLDKEWKSADRNTNQLIYTYLPAGSYTLFINSLDAEGREGKMPLQVFIKVEPPFWKTWWFFCLLLLALGGILFWYDRDRMKRTTSIQKMRSDIASDLHNQLSSALGNINVLSEMARLKADKEPQKSKEFIEQINSRSNAMINVMNDMLWSIDPDNDSMPKAMERLREHIDGLSNRYAVQIDLLIDKKVEALKLNMKLRQHLFWFFKNGITNMVRTGAADCRVHIRTDKSMVLYTIEFDNTNTDQQKLSNLLQRQELDQRLKETNAVLNVQTHKTQTLVDLRVPLG